LIGEPTERLGDMNDAPPPISRRGFWAVLASTAGVFIAISVWQLLSKASTEHTMSNAGFVVLLGMEAAMAAVWVPWLRRRGWTLGCVTAPAAPRDFLHGTALVLLSYTFYIGTFMAAAIVVPAFARDAAGRRFGGQVSWGFVLAVSVLNPVFEEFLYLGFVANVLRTQGSLLAVSASTVVRILVHLYQGPLALISNLPIGLLLGAYYAQTRRIWPAVVAHAIMDLLAFSALAHALS
jgi:CAAX protease family protein